MRHGARSSGTFSASWNVWIMVTIAVVLVFFGAWAIFSPTNNAAVEALAEEGVDDVVGISSRSPRLTTAHTAVEALAEEEVEDVAVEALAEEEVEDVVGESEQRLEADVKVAEAIQRAKNRAKPKDVAVEAESSSGLAEETGAEGAGEEDEQGVEVAGGEEGGSEEGGGEEGGGKEAGKGGEEEEGGGEEEEGAVAGRGGKGGRGGGGGKESAEEGSEEEGEEEGGGGGVKKGGGGNSLSQVASLILRYPKFDLPSLCSLPSCPVPTQHLKKQRSEECGGSSVGLGGHSAAADPNVLAADLRTESSSSKFPLLFFLSIPLPYPNLSFSAPAQFFSADLAAVEAAWDSEDAAAADPNVPAADLRTESTSSEAGSGLETQARESEEEARLDIREAATKKQDSKQTEDDFGEVEGGASIIQNSPESKDPPLMAGPVGQGTGEEGGGALPSLDLENAKFRWPSCGGNRTDWVPCLDNEKAIKALRTNKHYEHRERHCPVPGEVEKCLVPLPEGYKAHVPWPERTRHCPVPGEVEKCLVPLPEGYKAHVPWPESRDQHYEHRERHSPVPGEMGKCLVPLPEGYKAHVPWPESRDQVWYNNVPHPGLASYKKDQNWVAMEGDKLVFPGGGTQFTHGATGYINFVQKAFADVAWGRRVRVMLDMGCGVASLSAYLDPFDVRVISMAPKDEHEAQIQLALERGVLAVVGVMGTQRLPFSSNSFDAVHCARCHVPWHIDGGMLLLELNRVLRPGGFFIWSATPVYRHKGDDEEIWNAMTDLAERMCWTLKVREKEDGLDNVGVAVWQKPSDNRCYSERGAGTPPPMCESEDNPDAAWYVPMKACLNPVPAFKGMRAAQWPAMGRARLRAVPVWLQMLKRGVFGGPAVAEMKRDQIHWKKVVAFYDASFGIDWSTVRNVMDMNAHYGGFAAELAISKKPLWVLNVVPTSGPDSLPIVFERGLVGIYHDWCEAFNSYPRSYGLLHADHTVSQEVGRCDITAVLLEMDRLLRPEGWAVFRDHARMGGSILNIAASFHWRLKFNQTEGGEARSATRRIRVRAAGIDIEPRAFKWEETMKNCQIILGSSSQSQQQVLREIGVPFEIMVVAFITLTVANGDA
ncbi:unnamed protein product [Closterium sp. Naga37s-1]|nr:unnamed protein product [Closterium sp. Naga37s-1]